MKGYLACLVLALSLTIASAASAEHARNEGANFRFTIPTNWQQSQRGEVFVTAPKDQSLIIMLDGHVHHAMSERAAAFDTAAAAVVVGRMLGEVRLVGKPLEIRHNGMPCIEWEGEGKNHDGRVVEFTSLTCRTGERKGVTVVGFATQSGIAAHRPALRIFFNGLAPLRS